MLYLYLLAVVTNVVTNVVNVVTNVVNVVSTVVSIVTNVVNVVSNVVTTVVSIVSVVSTVVSVVSTVVNNVVSSVVTTATPFYIWFSANYNIIIYNIINIIIIHDRKYNNIINKRKNDYVIGPYHLYITLP